MLKLSSSIVKLDQRQAMIGQFHIIAQLVSKMERSKALCMGRCLSFKMCCLSFVCTVAYSKKTIQFSNHQDFEGSIFIYTLFADVHYDAGLSVKRMLRLFVLSLSQFY